MSVRGRIDRRGLYVRISLTHTLPLPTALIGEQIGKNLCIGMDDPLHHPFGYTSEKKLRLLAMVRMGTAEESEINPRGNHHKRTYRR